MNVEHLLAFIKTLDRADDHTIGVFASETGLGNNVRHEGNLSLPGDIFRVADEPSNR
jgi:hypothetical protein